MKKEVTKIAILKHYPVKNADYAKALEYLMFQHDEHTQKPILDEMGRMIPRDYSLIDGINCDPFSFEDACQRTNAIFRKNQSYHDVKMHHYILSFDPKDVTECGLTAERAQLLGMEFANQYFSGHQVLVCTHSDGHNGSGNIHVHIMLNSLRALDVTPQDFMERPCDSRAGYKFHETDALLRTMKETVMAICKREGLHQVDLLSPSEDMIPDAEYRARQIGQKKLDVANQKILDEGLSPAKTVFQTQKQSQRDAIREVSKAASSPEEFRIVLLKKYRIELKDNRGRYSYLHPDRKKYITARALGSAYEKDRLLVLFAENAKAGPVPEDLSSDPAYTILFVRSHLRLVTDLQACVKAKASRAYARKVRISNLQEMARTVAFVQEQGFHSLEELRAAAKRTSEDLADAETKLKKAEASLSRVNEQIRFTGQYLDAKATYRQMLSSPNKAAFRRLHEKKIRQYEEAVRKIRSVGNDGHFPTMKELYQEKNRLKTEYSVWRRAKASLAAQDHDLSVILSNIRMILNEEPQRARQQEMSGK